MKQCAKCKETKHFVLFSANARYKDGYQSYCRSCARLYSKKWYEANPGARYEDKKEQVKAKAKAYYAANAEAVKQQQKTYRAQRAEEIRKYQQGYKTANPDKVNSWAMKRIAVKLQASPLWADENKIREKYREAAELTKSLGVPYHVDHIVPLQSKLVCGLHWEGNLQVMPGADNYSKSNRHWPDMP